MGFVDDPTSPSANLTVVLRELLVTQLVGVLGTHGESGPYTSLVGFAAAEDLRWLVFSTGRATRKYANLAVDPRASLLVDNRSNRSQDFSVALAATILGEVESVPDAEYEAARDLLLGKLPFLDSFVASPSTALLRLCVSRYIVVSRFQEVLELVPEP